MSRAVLVGAEWREDAHSAELACPVLVSKAFDEAVRHMLVGVARNTLDTFAF